MKNNGLEVGRQKYTYKASGEEYKGENVYGILQAPRGDATEAIVLCAGWRNADGVLNKAGVALTLSMGRYLKSRNQPSPSMSYTNCNRMVPLVKRHHLPDNRRQSGRSSSLGGCLP